MRWLLAVVLIGCGDDRPCVEVPLGANTCTRIDGVWRLVASDDTRTRCGAELLSNPVTIRSRGSELSGTVASAPLVGVNYASGAFTLDSRDGRFSLNGQFRMVGDQAELSGGVVFGGPGQTCDALWDFTAHRE